MSIIQCCQWIRTEHGFRQCSRRATHYVSDLTDRGVCTQHARPNYDTRHVDEVSA